MNTIVVYDVLNFFGRCIKAACPRDLSHRVTKLLTKHMKGLSWRLPGYIATILDKIMWTSVLKYIRNDFLLINCAPTPPEQC